MELTIKPKFRRGQTVYIKTDPEQYPRMVTAYVLRQGTVIQYEVTLCSDVTYHSHYELSTEKSFNWSGEMN
jgi:hypothetical protein